MNFLKRWSTIWLSSNQSSSNCYYSFILYVWNSSQYPPLLEKIYTANTAYYYYLGLIRMLSFFVLWSMISVKMPWMHVRETFFCHLKLINALNYTSIFVTGTLTLSQTLIVLVWIGINPDDNNEHKEYLEKMCEDFVNIMIEMIDKAVAERKKVDDPVVEECMQQIRFCQAKCEGFHGREDTLEVYADLNDLSESFLHWHFATCIQLVCTYFKFGITLQIKHCSGNIQYTDWSF